MPHSSDRYCQLNQIKWKDMSFVQLFNLKSGPLIETYVLGFLMVPLRRLMLVIMSKSLNKKNPRSLRPPWPCGIETRSNDRNCRSLDTKSETPSMTPYTREKNVITWVMHSTGRMSLALKLTSSSRSVASRWSFSNASRSLQFKCNKMSCTNFKASCNGFWSGCSASVCLISLWNINS